MMAQNMPNADSWRKLVEISGKQLESLEYLEQAAAAFLKKKGLLKEYEGLMHELTQMVENARFQENTKASPWLGDTQRLSFNQTDFSLFHKFLASENAKAVVALFAEDTEKVMNYAISQAGEYIRNFTFDGVMLEGESLGEMDALFNAWLVENKMINSDGVIYQGTGKGEILYRNNKPMTVNADDFKNLMNNETKGFKSYVQAELRKFMPEKNAGDPFEIKDHAFPAQTNEPNATADVEPS
jgi:hypothetical protein